MGYMSGGACPKCGGTHTSIKVSKDGGVFRAQANCYDCGFADAAVACDDADLAVQTAKRAFNTVVVNEDGEAEGAFMGEVPNVDDLANTLAALVSVICKDMDCSSCPLTSSSAKEPTEVYEPGGLLELTPMKMQCSDMRLESVRKRLLKMYPGLPTNY